MKTTLFGNLVSLSVFSIAMVGLVGCPHPITPHPSPPTPTDTPDCVAACDVMTKLGCEEAKPIAMPDGLDCGAGVGTCHGGKCSIQGPKDICSETCVDVCQATQANGVWLNPSCVKGIKSCSEINTTCAVGRAK